MVVEDSHERATAAMVISSKGKGDKHEVSASCERERVPSIRTPHAHGKHTLATVASERRPSHPAGYAVRAQEGKGAHPAESGAGKAAVTLVSALGGGHEEAVAAVGAAAYAVGTEAQASADAAVERRGGVKVCGVRGRLPALADGRFNSAIEAERLMRLPSAKGLNEVR
eukprot:6202155-Pleurochrysis_carterae.AAC.2